MSFISSKLGNIIAGVITKTPSNLYRIAGERFRMTADDGDRNLGQMITKMKQAYLNSQSRREPAVTRLLLAEPPSLSLMDYIFSKAPWFYAIAPIIAGTAGLLALLQYIGRAKSGAEMIQDYMAERGLETIEFRGFFEALNLTALQDVFRLHVSSLEALVDLPEETFGEIELTMAQTALILSATFYLSRHRALLG